MRWSGRGRPRSWRRWAAGLPTCWSSVAGPKAAALSAFRAQHPDVACVAWVEPGRPVPRLPPPFEWASTAGQGLVGGAGALHAVGGAAPRARCRPGAERALPAPGDALPRARRRGISRDAARRALRRHLRRRGRAVAGRGHRTLRAAGAGGEARRIDGLPEALVPDAEARTLLLAGRPWTVEGPGLWVPLSARGEGLGVAQLTQPRGGELRPRPRWRRRRRFAGHGAVALLSARRFRALQRLALRDPDSSAYNLAYFTDYATKEIDKARRYGRGFSLLIFSLEGLPHLRARAGVDQARAAVRATTRALGRVLRESDVLAKVAEQEFLLLLPETDPFGAQVFLRRALAAARESPGAARHRGRGAAPPPGRGGHLPPRRGGLRPPHRRPVGPGSSSGGPRFTAGCLLDSLGFWEAVELLLGSPDGPKLPGEDGADPSRRGRVPEALFDEVQAEIGRALTRDPRQPGPGLPRRRGGGPGPAAGAGAGAGGAGLPPPGVPPRPAHRGDRRARGSPRCRWPGTSGCSGTTSSSGCTAPRPTRCSSAAGAGRPGPSIPPTRRWWTAWSPSCSRRTTSSPTESDPDDLRAQGARRRPGPGRGPGADPRAATEGLPGALGARRGAGAGAGGASPPRPGPLRPAVHHARGRRPSSTSSAPTPAPTPSRWWSPPAAPRPRRRCATRPGALLRKPYNLDEVLAHIDDLLSRAERASSEATDLQETGGRAGAARAPGPAPDPGRQPPHRPGHPAPRQRAGRGGPGGWPPGGCAGRRGAGREGALPAPGLERGQLLLPAGTAHGPGPHRSGDRRAAPRCRAPARRGQPAPRRAARAARALGARRRGRHCGRCPRWRATVLARLETPRTRVRAAGPGRGAGPGGAPGAGDAPRRGAGPPARPRCAAGARAAALSGRVARASGPAPARAAAGADPGGQGAPRSAGCHGGPGGAGRAPGPRPRGSRPRVAGHRGRAGAGRGAAGGLLRPARRASWRARSGARSAPTPPGWCWWRSPP